MAIRAEARFGLVPHFDVATLDGRRVRYQDIWQRRNLVLVVLPSDQRDSVNRYVQPFTSRLQEFEEGETAVVVTTDPVPGLAPPRVVVADRWGEILHIVTAPGGQVSELPGVDDVLSWVWFTRIQCPECPP
jgi:hypothetical protein